MIIYHVKRGNKVEQSPPSSTIDMEVVYGSLVTNESYLG